MTCIVAYKDKNKDIIYLAGDKCGSNGHTQDICIEPKVFQNGDFYIGYTTSFYMGQLLKHAWFPPEKLQSQTDDNYLHVTIKNSIAKLFRENNFGKHEGGYELGTFILIYKGRIFTGYEDLQFFENKNIATCGCGEVAARAAIMMQLENGEIVDIMFDKLFYIVSQIHVGVSKEYDLLEIKL